MAADLNQKAQKPEPMEVDEIYDESNEDVGLDLPQSEVRLRVITADPNDLTSATYQFDEEDHTLGNSLRWTVAKDPKVEYVGYSIPHPAELKMNFRIQTIEGKSAKAALDDGLTNLISMCQHVEKIFNKEFQKKRFTELPDEREEVKRTVAELLAAKKKSS